jgi:hypothetical protein
VDVSPVRLFDALVQSVTWARYWQEPDGIDQALAGPGMAQALAPVAARVAAAAPSWWSAPVDAASQRLVDWEDAARPRPSLVDAAVKLAGWREAVIADDLRAAERPTDVRAHHSGHWWSAPCLAGLPTSARFAGAVGPVGLSLVEDELGWTAADAVAVAPTGAVRVAEIGSSADWAGLVAAYPLDVTRSRRHDWYRATGLDARWFIPDFRQVAEDVDGVHVSVRGYLEAAGRAFPVADGFTVLAGWNPDQTYWLADCLTLVGETERWIRDEDAIPLGWRRA